MNKATNFNRIRQQNHSIKRIVYDESTGKSVKDEMTPSALLNEVYTGEMFLTVFYVFGIIFAFWFLFFR